jgi:hypothetical protein
MKRMKTICVTSVVCLSLSLNAFSKETLTPFKTAGEVPQNPTDLWKDYDPRSEDLDVKVIKEWKAEGVVTRYITFKVGTFKGADSRIAAYYSIPKTERKTRRLYGATAAGNELSEHEGCILPAQGLYHPNGG